MIKLPEPVASRIWCPEEQNAFQYNEEGDGEPHYTEAQLKQAVSDAYYEAAKVASSGIGLTTVSTVDRIRALIKEIDA